MASEKLDMAAFVIGSKYRVATMLSLAEGPSTPTRLAREHSLARSHISRALAELSERDLVEVHGEEGRTRIYSLSAFGHEVHDAVEQIEGEA